MEFSFQKLPLKEHMHLVGILEKISKSGIDSAADFINHELGEEALTLLLHCADLDDNFFENHENRSLLNDFISTGFDFYIQPFQKKSQK